MHQNVLSSRSAQEAERAAPKMRGVRASFFSWRTGERGLTSGMHWPCSDRYISRWAKRFVEDRQSGLYSRHQGSPARTLTPKLESKILNWTLKRKPTAGATRWSTRKLGRALGLSHMMIARVWTKRGLVA